jgi:uncharacterized protein (TIGR02147 family)
MTVPSVFHYDDYRRYVIDWLAARPSLSQRWLADRLEVSASMVSMILGGRRDTTLDKTAAWCAALGFDAEEASYFTALLNQEHHPDLHVRRDARHRVAAAQQFHEASHLADHIDWLGSWVHLTLLEAARADDFTDDPEVLAARLWPPVDAEVVRGALADLIASGSLHRDDHTGGWRTDLGPLRTAMRIHETEAAARAAQLHRTELGHALRALEELPGVERTVVSVTMSVPRADQPHLLDEARQLLIELATSHASDAPGEVMQVVLAAFPHTRSPSE